MKDRDTLLLQEAYRGMYRQRPVAINEAFGSDDVGFLYDFITVLWDHIPQGLGVWALTKIMPMISSVTNKVINTFNKLKTKINDRNINQNIDILLKVLNVLQSNPNGVTDEMVATAREASLQVIKIVENNPNLKKVDVSSIKKDPPQTKTSAILDPTGKPAQVKTTPQEKFKDIQDRTIHPTDQALKELQKLKQISNKLAAGASDKPETKGKPIGGFKTNALQVLAWSALAAYAPHIPEIVTAGVKGYLGKQ